MAKSNSRRGLQADDMVDLARRIVLRAMGDLKLDVHDEPHVQAKEYARAASASGYFRGSPPSRQDATTRGHLASRFERRLAPLLDTMRTIDDIDGTRPHALVEADPEPVYVDGADLAVLDGGLRIVADDETLFDRVAVRDLTVPPSEADRHVILDVVRRNGRIMIIATAAANAVYGLAGVHLDDQGAILEKIEPTGAHDAPPLDEAVLERLWTIIGVGARAYGRTLPKARKQKSRPALDATGGDADQVEATAIETETDEAGGMLPALMDRRAPLELLMTPISDAPLSDDAFDSYAQRMAVDPTTRILLDVLANGLVEGRLPKDQDDLVTRIHVDAYRHETEELIRGMRKRYKSALHEPKVAELYEKSSGEAIAKMLAKARDNAASPIGLRFNMMLRLLAMHAEAGGAIEKTDHCDGDGRCALRTEATTFGILTVKNRTFFDIARKAQEEKDDRTLKTRREVPLTIVYRTGPDGIVGIIQQMDARHTNVLMDFEMEAEPGAEESELHWALRNVLREVVERRSKEHEDRMAETKTDGGDEECARTETGSDAAAFGPEQEVLRGIPANRRMRRHAQVSLGVCDYAAAARVIDTWFDKTARGHKDALMLDARSHARGWRIEHASDDDMHVWAVSVRAGPQTPPRIEIVVETTQERADAALPGVVRELADTIDVSDIDGPIILNPTMIMARPQMRALMEELTDSTRRLPVLVLTTDENGEYMVDPVQIARRTAGYLQVRTVSPSMTREMRDSWGQEFTVFNGAARIYQPGFDADRSNPLAHQRFMPGPNAHLTLTNAIKREAAATLSRYQIDGELGDDLAEAARLAAVVETVAEEAPTLPLRMDPPPVRFTPVKRMEKPREAKAEQPVPTAAVQQHVPEAADAHDFETEDATPQVDGGAAVVETDEPVDGIAEMEASVASGDAETHQGLPAPVTLAEVAVADPIADGIGSGGVPDPTPNDEIEDELPLRDDLEARIARIVAGAMERQNARIEAIETHIARVERERDTALRQVDAVRDKALASARREKEENDRGRSDDAELIRIAEQERDDALSDLALATAELEDVVLRNQLLEREILRLRAEGATPADRPKTLGEVGDWANAKFAGRLTVLPRACKALRKSNYADIERTVQMVELMAGPYVDARNKVDGAHELWLAGLDDLRVKDHKQLDAGGPEEQQYRIRHEGRTMRLDRHIKGRESSSRERGAFRVYYTYDEENGQVVIGWMPDHLTTAAT